MFLFTKRAKRVVKYAWGGFSILIILSMVLTYSGFTRIGRTQDSAISQEVLDELNRQRTASTTPETQALLNAARATSTTASSTIRLTPPTRATTTEQLKFSL